MNINLVVNTETPPIEGHENLLISEIDNLPASLCKSVALNNTINYLSPEQFQGLLAKVRHGGVVSVNAPDAMEVSSALCWGRIDINTFSSLTSNRLQQCTLLDTKALLEQHGYIVEVASIKDLSFYIRARRP